MLSLIQNELQDKKTAKVLVRSLQSIYKKWGKGEKCVLCNGAKIKVFNFPHYESFFGYYDRSPFNSSGEYIIFHRTSLSTRWNPRKNKPIELVLWSLKLNKEVKKWSIYAYNWQQGAKPQWIDVHKFIFNNYDALTQSYYSIIVDTLDMSERKFSIPSYESSKDFYLSLNFSRLAKFRPDYGYRNINVSRFDDENDGIFLNKYADDSPRLIVSIAELKQFKHESSMDGALHKVNHIMLSPAHDKIMFMHRWITPTGKIDRLYTYTFGDKHLDLVADFGMVSHCYWYGDDILGYMNGPGGKAGYYMISNHGITKMSDKIQYFGDGHPSVLGDEMFFDTYPDEQRMKHLYQYNIKTDVLTETGAFYESLGFENQCRCDLHPRFINANLVAIDSTHLGKRVLVLIELN